MQLRSSGFLTASKYIVDHGHCGKDVWPSGVERQLCQHFGGFALSQSVVHGPVEVCAELCDLPGGDQSAERYEASIPWGEPGS
ncbi:hypothetical protein D3C81_2149650 [compost metagenome]